MASKRGGKTQAKRGGGLKTGLILVTGLALGLGQPQVGQPELHRA